MFTYRSFPWLDVYTAYPQEVREPTFLVINTAPFALCSYANCSVIPGSDPPMAACGCGMLHMADNPAFLRAKCGPFACVRPEVFGYVRTLLLRL